MWRSLWRSFDRFSLPYFKYLIKELQGIKVVDYYNREVVVDILQSIVEIVTYGDRHDPSIFECFMEHQILTEFVRVLKISRNSRIEAPLLQYLSIMIQNLRSEHAIYYCFSNGYINSIITHEYDFDVGDLAPYYVSFLRAVSGKLNRDTTCLLVKVQEDVVTSFPLYTEALRFSRHGEEMIQTAIRSLTLSIFNVSDDMVFRFVTTPPVSDYFSDLVLNLREQCLHLDAVACAMEQKFSDDKRKELMSAIDKLLDDLYYVKDLICVGESRLSGLITQKLLGLLVVPIMIPLMQLGKETGVNISTVTSFYVLCRLLQVVDRKEMVDSVASLILYPHVASSMEGALEEENSVSSSQMETTSYHANKIEQLLHSSLKCEETDGNHWFGHMLEHNSSVRYSLSCQPDDTKSHRTGIFSFVFSENQGLLLGSLMLLLVLAESEDLDPLLSSVIGFSQTKVETADASISKLIEESIFMKSIPQILNALLKILGSTLASPVFTQWQTGWFLQKLIVSQRMTLNHLELHLFNLRIQLNASFHQSREQVLNELRGRWFDYIPDTLKKEWANCKKVLEESLPNKDPFFIFEVLFCKQTSEESDVDTWERMVNAVKVFVLHLQLKAYILRGCPPDDPLLNLESNSVIISPRRAYASDASNASFGSEVPVGSGVPCKIAFSKVGVRDIYMIPVAKGASGKLLLVEKHPFHSRHGIVIAIAPLAGLTPKIDEKQTTWLHLRIRELNPNHSGRRSDSKASNNETETRWTLGFSDAETCKAAYMMITSETSTQRSFVERLLAPFLYDNYLGDNADIIPGKHQAMKEKKNETPLQK